MIFLLSAIRTNSLKSGGSPPPMRGKDRGKLVFLVFHGITPAYAGKRFPGLTLFLYLQDHPRLCGEKLSFLPFSRRGSGSPPPMRGKENLPVFLCENFGITPAYAGKSATHSVSRTARRDHPRLCGEKPLIQRVLLCFLGSPPPMRGKGLDIYRCDFLSRITPAYAGKSEFCPKSSRSGQDHPRLCGEKL